MSRRVGTLLSCLASVSPVVAEVAPPAAAPWVEIEAGMPIACGVRFTFEANGTPVEAALRLAKSNGKVDLILSARRTAGEGAIGPASIATASFDTKTLVGTVAESSSGWEARGPQSPSVAPFLQELMIGGGTISVVIGDTATGSRVPGPLPQLVRATYLNCAGDLFRPEAAR